MKAIKEDLLSLYSEIGGVNFSEEKRIDFLRFGSLQEKFDIVEIDKADLFEKETSGIEPATLEAFSYVRL